MRREWTSSRMMWRKTTLTHTKMKQWRLAEARKWMYLIIIIIQASALVFFFFLSKEQRNIHSCTTKVHDILCEIRCCVIWTSCKHHIKYLADLYAVMWCTCIDYVLNHHTPDNTIVLFTWDMRYMCCVWESAAFTIFSYIHHVPFSDQDF